MNVRFILVSRSVTLCLLIFFSIASLYAQDTKTNYLFRQYNRYQARSIQMEYDGNVSTYSVTTQEEFDAIQAVINAKIQSGIKNIVVRISSGVYYYSENHLSFCNLNAGDVSLSFVGDDVTIVAGGDDYKLRKPLFSKYRRSRYEGCFPLNSVLLTDRLDEISFSSGVQQTDSLLEIVSLNEKICKIHTDNPQCYKNGKYIIVTTWYMSVFGPIVKVEDNWIYFKSSSLYYSDSYKNYNVNFDFVYSNSKRYPRYVVYNESEKSEAYINEGVLFLSSKSRAVHQCNNSTFLLVKESQLKRLVLDGISFVGSAEGQPLINLSSMRSEGCYINNCIFRSMKNYVIGVNKTNDVLITNCKFQDCYKSCVRSFHGSKNTQITDCVFTNNGRDFTQYNCVWCQGEDFYIARNIFKNFSYAAIRTGLHPTEKKTGTVSGIIEYNEIYYAEDYFSNYLIHTLMDSGAIYVSTQNDNTIIRYNYIHDYVGLKDNRGIFCDTGTQNTRIYGNIISNIPNSYCIDIWRVKDYDGVIPYANEGNVVFSNIIDGKYRFEGKTNVENNVLASNIVYYRGEKPQVLTRDLTPVEPDVFIESEGTIDLKEAINSEPIKTTPAGQELLYFLTR